MKITSTRWLLASFAAGALCPLVACGSRIVEEPSDILHPSDDGEVADSIDPSPRECSLDEVRVDGVCIRPRYLSSVSRELSCALRGDSVWCWGARSMRGLRSHYPVRVLEENARARLVSLMDIGRTLCPIDAEGVAHCARLDTSSRSIETTYPEISSFGVSGREGTNGRCGDADTTSALCVDPEREMSPEGRFALDPPAELAMSHGDFVCRLVQGQVFCGPNGLRLGEPVEMLNDQGPISDLDLFGWLDESFCQSDGMPMPSLVCAHVVVLCAISSSALTCLSLAAGREGELEMDLIPAIAPPDRTWLTVQLTRGRSETPYLVCVRSDAGEVFCGEIDVTAVRTHDENFRLELEQVPLPGPARELMVAPDVTCVLLEDDTVWCWGENDHGQLGQTHTDPIDGPVQVRFEDSEPPSDEETP